MLNVKLQDIINKHFDNKNFEHAEDYKFFRVIEDWCCDNIARGNWNFDYSYTINVSGADIPGKIIFRNRKDFVAFNIRFTG